MDLVPGFQELLQGLSPALTAPSFASLCTIITGWLFSGRGIVTRMIVAAGSGATKHFSSYHRLLSTASWSLDAMGLVVFTIIEPFLGDVGCSVLMTRWHGSADFACSAPGCITTRCPRLGALRSCAGVTVGWYSA